MAIGAYINHLVYNDGIAARFLDSAKNLVIVLLDENNKPLATSAINHKENSTATPEAVYLGAAGQAAITFSNKQLILPQLLFNYTKSLLTGNQSRPATQFAIVDATNATGANYSSNGIAEEEIQTPAFSSDTAINTTGNYTLSDLPVLLVGSLSNNPTIDSATNFYFAGATINFTEAAS